MLTRTLVDSGFERLLLVALQVIRALTSARPRFLTTSSLLTRPSNLLWLVLPANWPLRYQVMLGGGLPANGQALSILSVSRLFGYLARVTQGLSGRRGDTPRRPFFIREEGATDDNLPLFYWAHLHAAPDYFRRRFIRRLLTRRPRRAVP